MMNGQEESYRAPFYDGAPYSMVFDRLLQGLHRRIAAWADEGCLCLDACCGPGGLTFQLAKRCRQVDGIDISAKMIGRAELLRQRRKIGNASFRVGDVSRLEEIADGRYDLATIAMGLHEMPAQTRSGVLPQLLRVASAVMIADFVAPMPQSVAGFRNRAIERLAGRRHYAGYLDYQARGGLPTLIEAAGARILKSRLLDGGTLIQALIGR